MGELKIEGEHIERLILLGKNGQSKWFDKPGKSIELPVGQYKFQESRLEGGYVCVRGTGIKSKWITIAENKAAVLKIGAPLKQTLEVKRRGKALILDYKLLGIGGEAYTSSDRSNPPKLTICNGDKEIATGQFAFG